MYCVNPDRVLMPLCSHLQLSLQPPLVLFNVASTSKKIKWKHTLKLFTNFIFIVLGKLLYQICQCCIMYSTLSKATECAGHILRGVKNGSNSFFSV